MSVCLLLIHDGRDDALAQCIASLDQLGGWDETVVVDDSAHRLGFSGAIAAGWRRILEIEPRPEWVAHVEQDFVFLGSVPLAEMVRVLETHPHIAQVSLKRQAWSPQERAAGGIVEMAPDDFEEVRDGALVYTLHRKYWTTTPSVYSTRWCEKGWPQVPQSEGTFTHSLLTDPDLRFAIWGGKFDAPRVEHVGERVGTGY